MPRNLAWSVPEKRPLPSTVFRTIDVVDLSSLDNRSELHAFLVDFQSLMAKALCHTCCSYPCHATLRRFLRPTLRRLRFVAHFVAFFVPRFVVYASSQGFVETILDQPGLDTKGALMPALYPTPGLAAIPITPGPIRFPPTNPEAPFRCVCPGRTPKEPLSRLKKPNPRAAKNRRPGVRSSGWAEKK
jgi:hypothetical protein